MARKPVTKVSPLKRVTRATAKKRAAAAAAGEGSPSRFNSPSKFKSPAKSPSKSKLRSPTKEEEVISKVVKPTKTDSKKQSKGKVVKSPEVETVKETAKVVKPTKTDVKKPKGKIVKSPEVESLNETALNASKKSKNSAGLTTSSLVESTKLAKALSELKKFIEKPLESKKEGKSQLFEDELIDNVQILFSKKDLFTSKKNFKPALITLEGEVDFPKRTVALFVRDGLINKELLEKIEESELNEIISEIIPASELKSTYKQYEKRRELYSKYDLFLSDDALITSLPKLLGKVFYESKKLPIPIKISNSNFVIESILNQIQNKVLKSIIYHIPRSNSLTINLGSIEKLNESILVQVINKFQNEKLTAIYLKSNQSPSLPIYEVKTVYTKEDISIEDSPIDKSIDDVELSTFEKGLVELANPDSEIINLLSSKKKKLSLKNNKPKKSIKSGKEAIQSKVTKPIVGKKKKALKA